MNKNERSFFFNKSLGSTAYASQENAVDFSKNERS